MDGSAVTESAAQWWGARRFRYNVALALAGLGAFIAYVILVWSFEERLPEGEFEVTAFTIALQAAGYLVAMAVANVCYFLGPVVERVVKPADISSYRTTTYNLGLWFSVALPFLIPAGAAYVIVTRGS